MGHPLVRRFSYPVCKPVAPVASSCLQQVAAAITNQYEDIIMTTKNYLDINDRDGLLSAAWNLGHIIAQGLEIQLGDADKVKDKEVTA